MHVEEFSSGYFWTPLAVEPADVEAPCLNAADYADLRDVVYPDEDDDLERVVLKVQRRYFAPRPSDGTPSHVLEVPAAVVDALDIQNPPARREALVAKPWVLRYVALTHDDPTTTPD